MDNITHSLLGAALAKTRLGESSPLAPAALVVGANLPDFENFILAFFDHSTNMVQHRGLSHALLGVAVLIPAFTLLVRGVERWLVCKKPARSPATLLLGLTLAIGSHPLLDWLNTYGVRPWLPFDATWYYGDLVFIVDPWLWLLLGAAVTLAGKRTRLGSSILALLALLLTVIVILARDTTPPLTFTVWIALLTALVLGRASGFGQRVPTRVVGAALALAAAYVGFLAWSGRTAWRMSEPLIAAQLAPGEQIIAHTISPQPAHPLRWQIVAETPLAVYRHEFSITRGPGGAARIRKALDDPIVQRAADSRAGAAWRAFARHPLAAVARTGNAYRVYLLDARYGLFPPPEFATFTLDLPRTAESPHSAYNASDESGPR